MLSFRALGWPREPPSRSMIAGGTAGALACICWPREAGLGSDVHATIVLSAAQVLSRRQRTHSSGRWRRGTAAGTVVGLMCASSWWSLSRYSRAAVTAVQLCLAHDVARAADPQPGCAHTQSCGQVASTAAARGESLACPSAPTPASVMDAADGVGAVSVSGAELESRAHAAFTAGHAAPLNSFWLPFIAVQGAVRACDMSRGAPTLASFTLAAAAGLADGTCVEFCRAFPASILMVSLHVLAFRLPCPRMPLALRPTHP
eukprot:scaffold25387_cov101-Isochrysis_galbana.AAC.1